MNPIKVMVNGLPGNMSTQAAEHIVKDSGLKLIPYALTGPEIEATETKIGPEVVRLIKPEERQQMIESIKQNSRNYAKRQLTWFRKDKRIHWMEISENTDFSRLSDHIIAKYNGLI